MSDREGHSGNGAPTDEDLSLPKATVAKMIAGLYILTSFQSVIVHFFSTVELLPNDVVCAKETRDLVIECCVGEHDSTFTAIALNSDQIHCRIHPFNILRGE